MVKKIILIVFVLAAFQACKTKSSTEQQQPENIQEPVKTTMAEKKNYNPSLEFTGTFFAYQEANLGTTLPGKVEKVYFPKGAYVQKGDLLAELSGELLTQALIENSAIKTDFGRVQRLKEKGSVTIQDYDHIKAKLDASEEKVKLLKKGTEIRAPFSGIITDYIVKEGENYLFSPKLEAGYSMTSGIISLMQTNQLILKIDINEKDIPKITKNLKVTVTTDIYPDKVFEGKIMLTEPSLNVLTRSATTEILVNNKKQLLKPGMSGHASILLPESTATFVTQEAIVRQPGTGTDYIYYVEDGKARMKPIKVEGYFGTDAIIDSISTSLPIITAGKNKVKEGLEVKIIN